MKTFFSLLTLLYALSFQMTPISAQPLKNDCLPGQDFGGLLSSGDPDVLSLGVLSGNQPIVYMQGCFVPSEADYNDLFRIFVPAGYQLTAIQFGLIAPLFENLTEVNFSMWYGNDCQPIGNPDIYSGGYGTNGDDDPLYGNMIAGVAPLPSGWYSFRMDMNSWPSTTYYQLHFTFSCEDGEAPSFTTAPGALDASLSCSNAAGIAAALALEPQGTDNSGSVSLVLSSDQTTPVPGCPNAYTRVRTWTLEDGCGNNSAQSYTQTITVTDQTGPAFTTNAGALDAVLNCNDAAGLAAALALVPSGSDACGAANLLLIADHTTPDPECPGAYNRVRTWRLVDACGNQSLAVFHQSIQVQDNTAPMAAAKNGVIAISDPEGYALTPEDVLQPGAYDACSDIDISISPATLGCELLGEIVPVTVQVTDACGNATEVIAMIEVTEDTSIKAPWDHSDIGAAAKGDAAHSPCQGVYTVTSSGFSSPGSDVAHFVYVELCGNGEITARVAGISPAGGFGGIMVRENLQQGARKAALKTALNNTLRREVRTVANTAYQVQQSPALPGPVWMRITRSGNTFNMYASANGSQWQFQGAAQLNTGNCVMLGLFAESTHNNLAITATFDNVSVSGGIMAMMGQAQPAEAVLQETAANWQEPAMPRAYPNPGTGEFQIDLSALDGDEVTMAVMDLHGKVLFTRRTTAGSAPEALSLSSYPAGVYFLHIRRGTDAPQVLRLVRKQM